jgi:TonB family protein
MKALLVGFLLLAAQAEVTSTRFARGKPPALPPLAQNGGLVGLELRIAPSGIVQDAIVIDDAPPFTEEMKRVVRLWTFELRESEGLPAPDRIAVIGLFRAPTLLGGAPPPPNRVSSPSPEVPYPTATATPAYPPQALAAGAVMLEVEVDDRGAVANVEILGEADGFGAAALEAARQFRFQAAKRDGRPVFSRAILVFGFPQPLGFVKPR